MSNQTKSETIQCINYWRLTVSNACMHDSDCVVISGRDVEGFTKFMLKVEDAEKLVKLLQEHIDKLKP